MRTGHATLTSLSSSWHTSPRSLQPASRALRPPADMRMFFSAGARDTGLCGPTAHKLLDKREERGPRQPNSAHVTRQVQIGTHPQRLIVRYEARNRIFIYLNAFLSAVKKAPRPLTGRGHVRMSRRMCRVKSANRQNVAGTMYLSRRTRRRLPTRKGPADAEPFRMALIGRRCLSGENVYQSKVRIA